MYFTTLDSEKRMEAMLWNHIHLAKSNIDLNHTQYVFINVISFQYIILSPSQENEKQYIK